MNLVNCICKAVYSLAILIIFQPNIFAEGKFSISEEDKNYWAFQPVDESIHKDSSIDIIVNNAIKENELEPNGEASREVLIKRAYFDLIGLSPRYEEIEAFVSDPSSTAKAFSELIDKLLQMPEYGERWGRHWLDVVRYAQTNGYERDDEKPNAWRYRDYVIDAFNTDKPYDRFILEQLAGDELIAEAFNTYRPFVQGGDEGGAVVDHKRRRGWTGRASERNVAKVDVARTQLRPPNADRALGRAAAERPDVTPRRRDISATAAGASLLVTHVLAVKRVIACARHDDARRLCLCRLHAARPCAPALCARPPSALRRFYFILTTPIYLFL